MQTYQKHIIHDINNYMSCTGCHKLYDADDGMYANAIFAWLIKIQNYYEFNYIIYMILIIIHHIQSVVSYTVQMIDTHII